MSDSKQEKPNKAVELLQKLNAIPKSDAQEIRETRGELISMYQQQVQLLQTNQSLAGALRSDEVKKSPNLPKIVDVTRGIVSDLGALQSSAVKTGKEIAALDTVKDKDMYILGSIQVHQSMIGWMEQYEQTVVPQLNHLNQLMVGQPLEPQQVQEQVHE